MEVHNKGVLGNPVMSAPYGTPADSRKGIGSRACATLDALVMFARAVLDDPVVATAHRTMTNCRM